MKKLYRSRTDKVLGGIIGGLRAYFDLNVDTNVLRLVTAGLTLFMPVLALLYFIGWVIIPEEPRGGSNEQ
ncbi:PspC domain-containing protein [Coprothermobacter platensis]|uniref:PspC domain-containing protein n=1 Tax=Coprothermobacter platensis TaxID=108819 RepID=UPI00036A5CBF|nr:PspC domain-containing protein [Coprothermobacter platensis]